MTVSRDSLYIKVSALLYEDWPAMLSRPSLQRTSAYYMAQESLIVTPRVYSQDAVTINPPEESQKLSDQEWYHKMMLLQS